MTAIRPLPPELTPHAAWLETLLSDSRAVVATLLWEPLIPPETLREQVVAYDVEIKAAPRADKILGGKLVVGALALLDATCDRAHADKRLAQVAVRYFVMDDDGDDDLLSPFGLDDDVEVFNAVVTRIGLPELAIDAL